MLVDAEKAKEKLARMLDCWELTQHCTPAKLIRAADLSDCRLSPPRDDLEKAIVLSQDEIDALEWTWGMGDLECALQNLELERRTLSAQVAELKRQIEDDTEYRKMREYAMKLERRAEAAEAQVAELSGLNTVISCCYDELKKALGRDIECPAYVPDAINELADRVAVLKKALASAACPDPKCSDGMLINTSPDPQYDQCEWCYGRAMPPDAAKEGE